MQKLDPEIPPLKVMRVEVEVVNEDGPRFQAITVRYPEDTPSVTDLAKEHARRLGFFTTGNVRF